MRFRMKPGMGKHRTRDRTGTLVVIHPGEIIDCDRCALGGATWKFDQLDPEPTSPGTTPEWRVEKVGDRAYNVVNVASGLPLNDAPLSAEEAADIAGVPIDSFCTSTVVDETAADKKEPDA